MQTIFPQNIIAILWDFDETMTPEPMQKVLFDHYKQDSACFWEEVQKLSEEYKQSSCHQVSNTLVYLNHILDYVQEGKFNNLSNQQLQQLGKHIEFYPGLPELFSHLNQILEEPPYSEHKLGIEHYVLSTGLRKLIEGSRVAKHLAGIWGCEFIEDADGRIARIAYVLDDTTKTRAVFEINKGVNKDKIQVNDSIKEEHRRVPIEYMIYIADGPSDVPVFSVIRKHNGRALGVYDPNNEKKYDDAYRLQKDGRINNMEEADYREGKAATKWLKTVIREIADTIVKKHEQRREQSVSPAPHH